MELLFIIGAIFIALSCITLYLYIWFEVRKLFWGLIVSVLAVMVWMAALLIKVNI